MASPISFFTSRRRCSIAIFWCGAGIYFCTTLLRIAVPGSIFNQLQNELGCGANGVVALGAFFMYTYALCQPLGGVLADKYGGVRISLLAATLFAVGSLGFLAGGGIYMMALSRTVCGAGAGLVFIGAAKLVDDLYKRNFALVMGVLLLIGCAGGFVGVAPLIALAETGGWRLPLFLVAALTVAFTAGEFYCRRRIIPPPPRRIGFSLAPVWNTLAQPPVLKIFIGSATAISIYSLFVMVIGRKFLEECAGLSPEATRLTLSLMIAVALVFSIGGGMLSKLCGNRRRGVMRFFCATSLAGIVGVIFSVWFALPGIFHAAFLLLLSPAGGAFAVFGAAAREVNDPNHSGVTIGVLNFLGLHWNLWVSRHEIHQNPPSVKRQSGIIAPDGRFYSVCRLTAVGT